jgi:hypothetical protein
VVEAEEGDVIVEDGLTSEAKTDEYKPDLASLKKMFEEAADLTKTARLQAQIDRDYFDGPGQWSSEERLALQKRNQPDSYFNRIRPAIEGTIGLIEQGQTDPKAWPRNPQDEQSAEVATKVLRYIEDKADFDQTKMECAHDFFIEGVCAVIVEADERLEIQANHIRYEEFFFDPRSRRKDFEDARYLGIAKWRYADDVAREFPDAKADIERSLEGAVGVVDDTFQDRPTDISTTVQWVDKKKRRVMVVELYHLEAGEWRRCVYHAGGLLEFGASPYRDKYGTRCPIIAASCYIDRENNRYGKVRDMRGPQDEINKRRSKLLHLINASQIQAVDPAAVEVNADDARREAARPDGVIPYGWQKVPTTDVAAGQANLLAEAKSEIERMGPNPAILGRQGETQSGRAQLVRQQAGLTELAPVLGVFDRWMLRVYRAMWETARQFWTAPMWIRVTDDEGAPEFIGLNMPATVETPYGPQQTVEHPIAEMDVDITIETTPDTANVQQEQFLGLIELVKSGAVQIPPQILIKASSLPDKTALLEEMKALSEQPNPQAELQLRGAAAEVQKTEAEAALTGAKAQNEMLRPEMEAVKLAVQSDRGPPPGQSGATGASPV